MSAGTLLGAIAGGVMGLGQTALGAEIARRQSEADRSANYRYGEMAAQNADKRTRLLYQDFYSPQALLNQYRAAGLSPSLMFGGTPGQGGMSGAQGNGASGPQTAFMPPSIIESALQAAQIANINAQTQKTKAETEQIQPLAESTIAKQLAEAGHANAAAAATAAEAEGTKLDNYLKEHTMDANIFTICEMADKAASEAQKMYHEMRSAKVLADVDEATFKTQVDTRIEALNNLISSTAKNKQEVAKIQQDLKYQIYTWDLEWRKLDVQERQQTTYEQFIDAQIPKIEKELELKAQELGIEKKKLWINATTDMIKSVAIGAAAVSQFKNSNATPAGAEKVLKPTQP